MPIRPENRKRYPQNWKSEIRPAILARAGDCCEGSPGFYPDCRVPNHTVHPVTGGYVVLTVAHLAPPIEDCRPENLQAMCQRCHFAYDRALHQEVKRQRRSTCCGRSLPPGKAATAHTRKS